MPKGGDRFRDRNRVRSPVRRRSRRPRPAYAAIDLGTNNCRMLVARPEGDGFRVIDGFSRIVRLGEGLAATGRLAEAAIERTVEALRICAARIGERRVKATRSVATEACRRARNGADFVARVKRETGLALEPISAAEEAALTLAGCVPLLRTGHPRALMFDIGGGSTELMWIETPLDGPPTAIDVLSLPFGVVSLAEEHGGRDGAPGVPAAVADRIDAHLAAFEDRHRIAAEIEKGRVHMLGTSGTVTTVGAIYLDLPRYDRSRVDGISIRMESVRAIAARLSGLGAEALTEHACIGPGRADLMVMGCAILTAICRRWPVGELTAADRGIREGLLMGLMAEEARPGPQSRP